MAASDSPADAADRVISFVSSFTASNGAVYTATNHLVQDSPAIAAAKRELVAAALNGTNPDAARIVTAQGRIRHKYLLVWAGDFNAADTSFADLTSPPERLDPANLPQEARDNAVGPDFVAVLDATKGSPTYGKVVNTVTTGPLVENEPHHTPYLWHKGQNLYAGSLYSDITYVFDVSALPRMEITGVNLPQDTPCGSVPDAFVTLEDGTAYGTYMGGADVPGPCTYTNGEVRISNGFAGSPGSLVRIGEEGQTLAELPAALPRSEDSRTCPNYPVLPIATCANPHGIQAREDLDRLITADFAEPRNLVLDPVSTFDPFILRNTVRIWDISDRNNAKVVSVSYLPDGPRRERNPLQEEPRGVMEIALTRLPQHKGAFASTFCGGVVYYTPDVTVARPVWREVWDATAYARSHDPQVSTETACSGASWIQTSLDDKYLYHAVIGRGTGSDADGTRSTKQIYALDIRKLLKAGTATTCSIDTVQEASVGGSERDCPRLSSSYRVDDKSSGGPHWGALDNFGIGKDGLYRELTRERRLAFSNYFVARTTIGGDHRVCIVDIGKGAALTLDEGFVDEYTGAPCVSFNRTSWPHGDFGEAKPHSILFAIADEDIR
ncbi:MAG: hypothetical protein ACT4PP_14595 [Sporichthyaceae bacterium]